MLSPEKANELSLKEHTRKLIKEVERETGKVVEWGAVEHHDTKQPHIHVLVRGVTQKGKLIQFRGDFLRKGIRKISQKLITQKLGLRSVKEIEKEKKREVKALRVTSLDRQLILKLNNQEMTVLKRKKSLLNGVLKDKKELEKRLKLRLRFLKEIGLAKRQGGKWRLSEDLVKTLRELSSQNDKVRKKFLNQMKQGLVRER